MLSSLQILGFSRGGGEEASSIYKELRERGKMIGEFAILIAAIVKLYNEKLVTRDEDFKALRGLELIK